MMKSSLVPSLCVVLAACAANPEESSLSQPAKTDTTIVPIASAPLDSNKILTRIDVGSCNKQQNDQSIWDKISQTNPDLFLFIGDNVYGDIWSKDPAMTELKEAYRELAKSEPFKRLREKTPVLVTWDDHDYGLNDAGGSFELKKGTEALFEDVWALPEDDPRRHRDGVYSSTITGPENQRVQIIMLDTRFFRSELKPTDEKNAPGKERYLPDPDPSKTMLGEAQYKWLAEQLEKPADVRFIVSSIQVIADGHGWEAWHTLPTDRERFYKTIADSQANGVILISGDRHAGAFYERDDLIDYPLIEMTTSALNAPSSVWRAQSGETRIEPGLYRLGTMEFEANFGQIDIDWQGRSVKMALIGEDLNEMQSVNISLNDLQVGTKAN
ncbi:MAG: alkaline phosphatase D family protein [Parvularcula sp.]